MEGRRLIASTLLAMVCSALASGGGASAQPAYHPLREIVGIAIVGDRAIALATWLEPRSHRWRVRRIELNLDKDPGPVQFAALSRSGTKAVIVTAAGRAYLLDLTERAYPLVPLAWLDLNEPQLSPIPAPALARVRRLPDERFAIYFRERRYVVNDRLEPLDGALAADTMAGSLAAALVDAPGDPVPADQLERAASNLKQQVRSNNWFFRRVTVRKAP